MKTWVVPIKIKSKANCILLRGFFDIHAGVKACDIELLKQHVEELRTTPNMYGFLGGDNCECININDKRFDAATLSSTVAKSLDNIVMTQANEILDIFRPVKHKLLFSLEGNHEDKFRRTYSMDIGNYIAMGLEIPMLGYSAMIRLQIECDYNYKTQQKNKNNKYCHCVRAIHLLVTHGVGGIRLGTALNKMEDLIRSFEFDIAWGGHNHKKGSAVSSRLYMTRQDISRIYDKNKILILGGTYLRTYMDDVHSGYGERKMYAPTPLGCETLKIIPYPGTHMENGSKIELPPKFEMVNTVSATSSNFDNNLWDIELK